MIRYRQRRDEKGKIFYSIEVAPHEVRKKGGEWDEIGQIHKMPNEAREHAWQVRDLLKNGRLFWCATLADAKTCVEAWMIRAVFTARYCSD
jgi:hypothetical protein